MPFARVTELRASSFLEAAGMADRPADAITWDVRQACRGIDIIGRIGLHEDEAGLVSGNEDRAEIAHRGALLGELLSRFMHASSACGGEVGVGLCDV
jgi:hypothetical protein